MRADNLSEWNTSIPARDGFCLETVREPATAKAKRSFLICGMSFLVSCGRIFGKLHSLKPRVVLPQNWSRFYPTQSASTDLTCFTGFVVIK